MADIQIPTRFQVIVNNIIKLKELPRYEGALIFGSIATGKATESSDLDVRVLVDAENDCENVNHLLIDGNKVDITFRSFEQIKEELTDQMDTAKKKPWIAGALILFDKSGQLEKLKAEAEKVMPRKLKPEKFPETLRVLGYSYYKAEKFLEKDPQTSMLVMHFEIKEILETHYRVNGRWWLSDKRMLNDLDEWDKEMAGLLKEFLGHSDVNLKFRVFSKILTYVTGPLGGLKPTYEQVCLCKNCHVDLMRIGKLV